MSQTTSEAAREFLACRRMAVTGVSRVPKEHSGTVVHQGRRAEGDDVVPVEAYAQEIEGHPAQDASMQRSGRR